MKKARTYKLSLVIYFKASSIKMFLGSFIQIANFEIWLFIVWKYNKCFTSAVFYTVFRTILIAIWDTIIFNIPVTAFCVIDYNRTFGGIIAYRTRWRSDAERYGFKRKFGNIIDSV